LENYFLAFLLNQKNISFSILLAPRSSY